MSMIIRTGFSGSQPALAGCQNVCGALSDLLCGTQAVNASLNFDDVLGSNRMVVQIRVTITAAWSNTNRYVGNSYLLV